MIENLDSHRPTFAGLNALGPRVMEVHIASISTVLEPSTAASATAVFPRPLDNAALATHTAGTCRG